MGYLQQVGDVSDGSDDDLSDEVDGVSELYVHVTCTFIEVICHKDCMWLLTRIPVSFAG